MGTMWDFAVRKVSNEASCVEKVAVEVINNPRHYQMSEVCNVLRQLPAVTMTLRAHLLAIKEASLFKAMQKSIVTLRMCFLTPRRA